MSLKFTTSLRLQSFFISAALLALLGLVGARSYRLARLHVTEIEHIQTGDIHAQTLLTQMEGLADSVARAEKKLRATHEPSYAALVARGRESLAQDAGAIRTALETAYPELAAPAGNLGLRSSAEIHAFRELLNDQIRAKLVHARGDSRDLLALILLTGIAGLLITAWIVFLFYRKLNQPIDELIIATERIRGGDLSYRVETESLGSLTEIEQLARSFNLMAERIERLDQAKGEFLATVSHEIKNPLTALREGLSLLSNPSAILTPPARDRAFSACLIASKRLETMINNLLEHSRLENGLFEFDLTHRNLTAAVQTAIDEVRPIAERKGMSIRLDATPDLQSAFSWDGMVQVFENLLMNAIKYGQEKTSIEISGAQLTEPAPHIRFAVTNYGPEIPGSDIPRIFDRFFRGERGTGATHSKSGLGLGLHVVRKVVEAHQGQVSADSAQGRTTIEICLPHSHGAPAL